MKLVDLQNIVAELVEEVLEEGGTASDDAESIAARAERAGNTETARIIRVIIAAQ